MKLHFVAPARSKAGYLFGKETFPPLGFVSLAAYTHGLDSDEESVVPRTLEFPERSKLTLAQFVMLTLLPGTRASRRLLGENRVGRKFWYTPGWERRPGF